MIRTRFAPSPTGPLHLGSALTAVAGWWFARSRGGATILRIEDLDRPRTLPGSEDAIVRALEWLGLDWDEGPGPGGPHAPYHQSERDDHYERALRTLERQGKVYPCDCSRKEIRRIASAPHAGEEIVYPGTCRDRDPSRPMKRPPSWRVRVPDDAIVAFVDGVHGERHVRVREEAGDFIVRRSDGLFAYQLAVTVDDLDMRISHVHRGDDLLGSTGRQIWLARSLGQKPPTYAHLAVVRAPDGERMATRSEHGSIDELRARGIAPERVLGAIATALGILDAPQPISAGELKGVRHEHAIGTRNWQPSETWT